MSLWSWLSYLLESVLLVADGSIKIKYKVDGSIERYKARLVILINTQLDGSMKIKYKADGSIERYKARLFILVNVIQKNLLSLLKWSQYTPCCLSLQLEISLYIIWMSTMLSSIATCKRKFTFVLLLVFGPPIREVCKLKSLCTDYARCPSVCSLSSLPLFVSLVLSSLMPITHCLPLILAMSSCVIMYVDDLLITGNSFLVVIKFKASLSSPFQMKDLGILKYFLGIEVV